MASYAFTLAEVSLLTVTVRRLIKHFNVIGENDLLHDWAIWPLSRTSRLTETALVC